LRQRKKAHDVSAMGLICRILLRGSRNKIAG